MTNPIITRDSVTDVDASFVADPFLYQQDGLWYLFFELLNRTSGRGEIGLATSADLIRWEYQRVVLAESFHLSYPQVIAWEGEHYMLPETQATSSIRLYKAQPFPGTWKHVHTLLEGELFADSTLFRQNNKWWLFTQTSAIGKNDNLRLYYADDLFGSWTEHPSSPVVENDPHGARPGGSVISTFNGMYRFAQDCKPKYGLNVFAFEITELTTSHYAERPALERAVLTGTSSGWNASRMHHVDAHQLPDGQWIAAVDGAFNTTMSHINGGAT
ncbi:MAG: hypothetical protein H7Z40_12240 [Phycisphaerae bacterium]|nr:hypothetical protein [Gemmatimonadaceae bacterium]